MKVLLDGLQLGNGRGIAKYTKQLLLAMKHVMPEIQLTVITLQGTPVSELTDVGIKVEFLDPKMHRLLDYLWVLGKPSVEMIWGEFDIVHAVGSRLFPAAKAKHVFTVHDISPLQFPQFHTKKQYMYYKRLLYSARRADTLITVSEASASELRPVVKRDLRIVAPGVVVPFGVQRLSWDQRRMVLCSSTSDPKKNVELFRECVRSFPDDEWAKNVCFTGGTNFVSDAQLDELYATTRVVVAPSLHEGYGMTVTEGLACGANVVASDIPAHRYAGGDKPIFFDPHSIDSLRDALVEAWKSPPRSLCAEWYASHSWSKSAEEQISIYQSLL